MKTFDPSRLTEINTHGFSLSEYTNLAESSGLFASFHAQLARDDQLVGTVQSAAARYDYFWIQPAAAGLIENAAAECFPGADEPLDAFVRLLIEIGELRSYYELNQPGNRFQCAAKFYFSGTGEPAGARLFFLENKSRLSALAASSAPDEILFFDGRKCFRYGRLDRLRKP